MFRILLVISSIFIASLVQAADSIPQAIGPFGTLNNRDSSYTLPADKAQDLLNVELTEAGKSVKKRKGYATAFTLNNATSPVHGTYLFYDSNGNDVSLFFNDTRLNTSINGGSPTVIFSTGASGATYQCTDSLGFAYCANSARSALYKINGSTSVFLTGFTSTGTMVTATPTRLVTAGFVDAPSRIDFSAETDFSTWGTGSLGTSGVQITINSPGARITHIVYAFGRIMWFKDTSFGYIIVGNQPLQTDWVVKTVSYDLGTNDNTSVYREGVLYFRGKDSHIYAFDGSTYSRLTKEISATINASQTRAANSWTQTSASDWNSGNIDVDMSTSSTIGDITSKTTSYVLTSTADWASGTVSDFYNYSDTITVAGNLQSTFPDLFDFYRNGTSSTKNVWRTISSGNPTVSSGKLSICAGGSPSGMATVSSLFDYSGGTTYYFNISNFTQGGGANPGFNLTLNASGSADSNPNSGTYFRIRLEHFTSPDRFVYSAINNVDGTLFSNNAGYTLPLEISFYLSTTTYRIQVGTVTNSGTHSWTRGNNFLYLTWESLGGSCGVSLDTFGISPQTFTYTSSPLDTGLFSPVWSTFTITSMGNGSFAHASQVSSDNSSFDAGVSVSSGSLITSARKRYVKLNTVFNQNLSSGTPLSIADYTINAGSTGTFRSAVKNAPNLTSWDSFFATFGSSITFFIRSSTNSITVNSSTPSWTIINSGGIPSISTGTFFQIRADLYSPNSSQISSLSDFTQNWFEGNSADKMYATFFDNKILFAVTSGAGATTNNKLLVYDLLNQGFLLWDIPSNGFTVRQNRLYFGSPSAGIISKYGDTDSDNGSAINSYWKSKDFFGDSPFTDKEYAYLSIVAGSVASSSMTVTYTVNGSSSSDLVLPLYTPNNSFSKRNRNLPAGKVGSTFNLKFGNNAADQPFEVFGAEYGIRPKPWSVTNP